MFVSEKNKSANTPATFFVTLYSKGDEQTHQHLLKSLFMSHFYEHVTTEAKSNKYTYKYSVMPWLMARQLTVNILLLLFFSFCR